MLVIVAYRLKKVQNAKTFLFFRPAVGGEGKEQIWTGSIRTFWSLLGIVCAKGW